MHYHSFYLIIEKLDLIIKKLNQAIESIEKAENNLFNDEVRLIHLVEPLSNQKLVYQVALKAIEKRQTGAKKYESPSA